MGVAVQGLWMMALGLALLCAVALLVVLAACWVVLEQGGRD